MKALVINLIIAVDRMAFQTKQLSSMGVEFERLPAISIDDLDENTYLQYCSTWERPLRKTEVACFFSHKNAWEEVIKSGTPLLILEDDAYISEELPCILDSLDGLKNIDCVTLEVRGREKIIAKEPSHEFCNSSLVRLYQDRTGAAGYVLWPSGAKKLLKRFEKGRMALADAFISSTYSLKMYQVEPAILVQHDLCEYYGVAPVFKTSSSVSSVKRDDLQLVDYLKYRFKRIVSQLRLGFRQLSVVGLSTKRQLLLSPLLEREKIKKE